MSDVQFIQKLAQPFNLKPDSQGFVEIKPDVDIGDSDFKRAELHLRQVLKLQAEILPNIFWGWCWFELATLLEYKVPICAVAYYGISAKLGLIQAKIKFAELVLQRFPGNFKELEKEAIGHIGCLAEAIDCNKIVTHPTFSVSVFKILGSFYCGEGNLEQSREYFLRAKQIIDGIAPTTTSQEDKDLMAVEKEQIDRFIATLSEL
jgi:tetratricopeptide (TPR) repeat protein